MMGKETRDGGERATQKINGEVWLPLQAQRKYGRQAHEQHEIPYKCRKPATLAAHLNRVLHTLPRLRFLSSSSELCHSAKATAGGSQEHWATLEGFYFRSISLFSSHWYFMGNQGTMGNINHTSGLSKNKQKTMGVGGILKSVIQPRKACLSFLRKLETGVHTVSFQTQVCLGWWWDMVMVLLPATWSHLGYIWVV